MGAYVFDYFDRQVHIFQKIWDNETTITGGEMNTLLSDPIHLFSMLKPKTESTILHSTSVLIDLWLPEVGLPLVVSQCPACAVFGSSLSLPEMTLERTVVVG